jgi:fatty-acyl-CoA synthase
MLLDHPDFGQRDLSSLRTLGAGGMMVPARLVRRIESTLHIPFGIMFGQTEACGIATQVHLGCDPADRAETVGKAHPQTEIKIADPGTGETVQTGVVGEICVRGYLVMSGYFEQPELTAAAVDAAGWLHTGDLGSMDDRGFMRVEGRVKEIINRGAEKFSPYEIEQVLRTHPSVADAAVVGVPDDTWGEVVAAFVRPSPGCAPTEAELFAFCRAQLAPYKTPKQWVFVDQFPMTPSGKVQKFILRDQLASEKVADAREGAQR